MSFASFFRNGNFMGLLLANTILGSAMPMLLILGGLTGLFLAPNATLVTLPASIQALAGLLAAAPFSLLMGRLGRRFGFAIGGVLAIIGAVTGAFSLMTGNFMLLCLGHFILGAALTSFQYFRFAAAEVVSSEWQPVAISLMLTSGLVAAIVGPQIFIMAKDALAPIPLAGAYACSIGCGLGGHGAADTGSNSCTAIKAAEGTHEHTRIACCSATTTSKTGCWHCCHIAGRDDLHDDTHASCYAGLRFYRSGCR